MAAPCSSHSHTWARFKSIIAKPDAIILSHQRSGTHFLQASLASHPRVHPRGEFLLQLKKRVKAGATSDTFNSEEGFVFRNKPERLNIGIVMYSQMPLFEPICGTLHDYPIIHLLRDPRAVALSILQMEADRLAHGSAYRAHYHLNEVPPPQGNRTSNGLEELTKQVASVQADFRQRHSMHPRMLTVTYEELTANQQVNALSGENSEKLLGFLGLPFVALQNSLRKSASGDGSSDSIWVKPPRPAIQS